MLESFLQWFHATHDNASNSDDNKSSYELRGQLSNLTYLLTIVNGLITVPKIDNAMRFKYQCFDLTTVTV